MAAFTYTKPVVGGSEDAWGDTLNANWDALGAFIGPLDSTELAVLDGITATTAELNFVDGVTSAIQTQLDGKQPLDADLTAVAGLATSGLVARTGAGTAAARSIAVSGLATIADGDAVAGNPTVGVPAASQAEAEAGTDNTKVMTPLRVAQSIVANAPSPPPALQASSSVSINQNTNYLNSLGRPVFVFASCYYDTINTRSLALQIDYGAGLVEVSRTTTSTGSSHTVCGVVPDGATYRVNGVTTNQTQFNAREFR
jgi:hypothetical protein